MSPEMSNQEDIMMTFIEMLLAVRHNSGTSQQDFARGIGISKQYLCNLEKGRRMPSVAVVEKICRYMGRGPKGRREWHVAGARAQGWQVD
jgi:transcriptional regulator with XRE-family HTH domain